MGAGHRAAVCPRSFLRVLCTYCDRMGHSADSCPKKRSDEFEKRKAEAKKREEAWIAAGGPERKAALEARKAAPALRAPTFRRGEKADDTASVASESTSASTTGQQSKPCLSEHEEKEARKWEKLLREISKIESSIDAGERVDSKQREKVQRRAEIENTLVMAKVRAGYIRFSKQ